MAELMMGIGVLALIALAVAAAAGIVKLAKQICAAAVGLVQHERMMRPQNVYFIGR